MIWTRVLSSRIIGFYYSVNKIHIETFLYLSQTGPIGTIIHRSSGYLLQDAQSFQSAL